MIHQAAQDTPLPLNDELSSKEESLESRQTDELIVAMVGPVGSGVTTTAKLLQYKLENDYGYDADYMKLSSLIKESAGLVGNTTNGDLKGFSRTNRLQDIGTELRKRFGTAYIAEKAIQRIGIARSERGGYDKKSSQLIVRPRRHLTLLDSLKHPSELDRLRSVYGENLWVFGVFAPHEVRQARMLSLNLKNDEIVKLFERDEEEGLPFGQKVRETIFLSNFFIRNDRDNDEQLSSVLDRYLALIFEVGVNTPTLDEVAMCEAHYSAASSACLSRQVGAVIYSDKGELIGKGANDVPKSGGTLYGYEDGQTDHRCYKWKGRICHNDDRKQKLYDDIVIKLKDGNVLKPDVALGKVKALLQTAEIRNLIEFSRSVHAEMEAIVSVARGQKSGLVGGTMYSTTFPCHQCARHIVAAGIKRVIYIEPYSKSLALDLHKDAISISEVDTNKVVFLQYEGVAPTSMLRLFKQHSARKQSGQAVTSSMKDAHPISRSPLDGFDVREQFVIHRVEEIESQNSGASNDG